MNKNLNKFFCILALCAVATQSAFTMDEQESSKISKTKSTKSNGSGGSSVVSNVVGSFDELSDILKKTNLNKLANFRDQLNLLVKALDEKSEDLIIEQYFKTIHDFAVSFFKTKQNSGNHSENCSSIVQKRKELYLKDPFTNMIKKAPIFFDLCTKMSILQDNGKLSEMAKKDLETTKKLFAMGCYYFIKPFQNCNGVKLDPKSISSMEDTLKRLEKKLKSAELLESASFQQDLNVTESSQSNSVSQIDELNVTKTEHNQSVNSDSSFLSASNFQKKKDGKDKIVYYQNDELPIVKEEKQENTPIKKKQYSADNAVIVDDNSQNQKSEKKEIAQEQQIISQFDDKSQQVETQKQSIIDEQKKPDDQNQVSETKTEVFEETKIDEKKPVVQGLDDKSKTTSEVIILQKNQENGNKVIQDSGVAVSNNYAVSSGLLKNKQPNTETNKGRVVKKDEKVAEEEDKACVNPCNIF